MDEDQVCAKAVSIIGTRELEKLKHNMNNTKPSEGGAVPAFDFGAVENILKMIGE